MVSFEISGMVVPVFTPINEDMSVNYSIITDYAKFLSEKGINGVLVGGTSGEAMCLNVDERKKLAESWVKAAKGQDIKVIVQVGGAPMPDVLELARHAESIHADAILTLPELYFKPKNAEQLVSYLEEVSKSAPKLPLLYYHFPMMSGVNIDIKQFFSLATSRIPNFRGMKADLGVALQVAQDISDKTIFIGNHLIAPSALLGYTSSIATVTNLVPGLVKGILEAVKLGDMARTRELQETLNRFTDAIANQGDWVPTMKFAMEMMTGIKVGPPRSPLKQISDAQKKNIRDNLSNYRHL